MSDIQADTQVIDPAPNEPAPAEAAAQPAAPAAPDTSWVPKRISEITNARRAAEQRAAEEAQRAETALAEAARLREQLAAPSGAQPTQPVTQSAPPAPTQNLDQIARAYAERMVREQTEQASLQSRITAINEAGTKEFGQDFDKSVQNLGMAGVGGPEFLRVLAAIPKAEAVVTWLGKTENLNEAMRIASLDPVQMGIELTKMSGKAAKDLGKQVSRAPAPIEPVSGSGGSDGAPPDPSDTKAWMAWRTKNARRK